MEPPGIEPLRIERLTPGHARAYRDLMLVGYASSPDAFTSTAGERAALPMSWWEGRLDVSVDADDAVFGAWTGDRLIGAAGLLFETRERARHKGTLVGMFVDESHRSRGAGIALVQAVLAHARSRPDAKSVVLTVTEGNHRAQSLYERAGFTVWGREPDAMHVGGRYLCKIHMACDLRA